MQIIYILYLIENRTKIVYRHHIGKSHSLVMLTITLH